VPGGLQTAGLDPGALEAGWLACWLTGLDDFVGRYWWDRRSAAGSCDTDAQGWETPWA